MGKKAVNTASDRRAATDEAFAHAANIHPLAARFPLMPKDELAALAADIKANGLRHPIVIFEKQILDGRNRHEACALAGVKPRFETFNGSLDDAMHFVVSENVRRRHLDKGQAAAIVVDIPGIVDMAKRAAKERQAKALAGNQNRKGAKHTSSSKSAPMRTLKNPASADIAAATGCSARLIEQAERVKTADPELYAQVRAGAISLGRAERILRDREAAKKRQERLEREGVVSLIQPADIRHGDFRSVLGDVEHVDLVFTDPPYPKEFLPLWSDLSAFAARALKPGHLLVAYSGAYYLPEVIARLSERLTYVWCGWLSTPGPAAAIRNLPLMSGGKPVLIFSNGELAELVKKRRFCDVAKSEGRTRDQHEWEQTQGPAAFWLDQLTERGELVVDPFVGSGTFALVAKTMGRRFVGSEIDLDNFEIARKQAA